MKATKLITLGLLLGTCGLAVAEDKAPHPERPKREIPPEVIKKFDKDGDGKLSDEEHKAAREERKAMGDKRHEEMIKKFDKDGDGKLSDEERKAAREERQAQEEQRKAEMIKKYDKDGDGKLSDEETKAAREERIARRKALLEKYDANKNGTLDPEEKKAAHDAGEEMPKDEDGPGPRRGHRGPEGKGPDAPPPAAAE
jgi:Ca2+-binding EF-hand superfamily protein